MSGMRSSRHQAGPERTHVGVGPCKKVSDRTYPDKHQTDGICESSGAFTDHCNPCYIVNKDERDQGSAYLLCDCDRNGSDATPGYFFELGTSRCLCPCRSDHMRLDVD